MQAPGKVREVLQRGSGAGDEKFRGLGFGRCLLLGLPARPDAAGARPQRGQADLIEQQLREKDLAR